MKKTRRYPTVTALTMVAAIMPGMAPAATAIDGNAGLICAVNAITGCVDANHCVQGGARAFELPQFLSVDFRDKEVRATKSGGEKFVSTIRNQQRDKSQILLQGVENGHGWTVAIDTRNGDMTASATGEDVSYILFGACIAPDQETNHD